ncbi:MAG: hypothetical protein RLZZ330_432 [Actinomycetota bacterium]
MRNLNKNHSANHNRQLGLWGEQIAVRHIEKTGGKVLTRNSRYGGVEVDIVFEEGRGLVVCEVKTRTSAKFGHPLEVVNYQKFCRLQIALGEAMEYFRSEYGRIDIIGIVLRPTIELQHIKGVNP